MIREHQLPGTLAACRCGKQPKNTSTPYPAERNMKIFLKYTQFRNTLAALEECIDPLECDFNSLTPDEKAAALQLIKLCGIIYADCKDNFPNQ